MTMQKYHIIDRASGSLDAQLLSSLTSGTFTFSSLVNLGSQSWQPSAGVQVIVTIDNEQILCTVTVSGGIATATIVTRGFNGTTAATHTALSTVNLTVNSKTIGNIQDILALDDAAVLAALVYQSTVTSITNGTTHTIAGDQTTVFTVGRVYVFKVSSTWYRGTITAASFAAGTTTITLNGDGLTTSGTVLSCGFEFAQSVNAAVDYRLVKECSAIPTVTPPSGYNWLFTKAGKWYSKDSSGNVTFLTPVRLSVSSSGGVLALDCSLASVFDCTLTENITGVTWSNGVEGNNYTLRIKQHASAAKTVVLGTSGGTRFSNTVASYVMSTTVAVEDVLRFFYHATDAKYDLLTVNKGFQASPGGTSPVLVAVGSFTPSAGTGNKAVTGLGFQPKMVKFYCLLSGGSGSLTYIGKSNGAATSASSRWALGVVDGYDQRTISSHESAALCINLYKDNGSGSPTAAYVADFVSMDSDGFTINATTAANIPNIYYEAVG